MSKIEQFNGLTVPLVTPFDGDKIDYTALMRVIERCACNGADAFVVLGTTGEAPTVTKKERAELLSFCKQNCFGKKIIAGVGTNDTKTTVEYSIIAEDCGADGLLCVCPYYNKPPKTGVIEHFYKILDSSALPFILYDVPSRTGMRLEDDVILEMQKNERVVGIKCAGDRKNIENTARLCNEKFMLYGGNDLLMPLTMRLGGIGYISAVANVYPLEVKNIISAYLEGDFEMADGLFEEMRERFRALYIETNPVAIKYALYKMGLIKNCLRLPMCPLSRINEEKIRKKI